MEEIISILFKVICVVGEFLLNILSGTTTREIIRLPGMLLYKIIWPPNWFNKMEADGITFYILGVIFYILLGIYFGFFCCQDALAS